MEPREEVKKHIQEELKKTTQEKAGAELILSAPEELPEEGWPFIARLADEEELDDSAIDHFRQLEMIAEESLAAREEEEEEEEEEETDSPAPPPAAEESPRTRSVKFAAPAVAPAPAPAFDFGAGAIGP